MAPTPWSDLRNAWDEISQDYQARQQLATTDVHYGPWAPPERELQLLGDVQGRRILDLGCGGGQATIALTRAGAKTTGLDLSDNQLAFARRLAAAEGVAVTFVQGTATDLHAFSTRHWDIVFSANVFPYLDDLPRCLAECARILRPGGRLVFSIDHPLRACFYDTSEDELCIYPVRSYFDATPTRWPWPERPDVRMQTAHHTVGQWLDLLRDAGFQLRRLCEPPPPPDLLDAVWPQDDALAALRCLPQTLIVVAEKA